MLIINYYCVIDSCLSLGRRQHTIIDVACVSLSAQSFYRAMYSRPDLDLFNFASVCRHYVIHILESGSSAYVPVPRCLRFEVFTIRTIHHVFTFSWKYLSRPWRFQWSVSRKAVLFHEFVSALVQGGNMYLSACNNGLIPREGFLSLNNLPTVVCCRWLEDKSNNSSIETCRSVVDTNESRVTSNTSLICVKASCSHNFSFVPPPLLKTVLLLHPFPRF